MHNTFNYNQLIIKQNLHKHQKNNRSKTKQTQLPNNFKQANKSIQATQIHKQTKQHY